MKRWDASEIKKIAASDDLHIAPFRADGVTCGTPTWIWNVVVDGRLFVRAWNGQRSRWYGSAMTQRGGQITVGGTTYDVAFVPADAEMLDAVDAAYSAKYAGSTYLPPMLGAGPRSATVEIFPR